MTQDVNSHQNAEFIRSLGREELAVVVLECMLILGV
jgi:hypothetical protein